MIRVKIIDMPDGSRAPETPPPPNSIAIRGDIEPGFYLCYEQGDEVPPSPLPAQGGEQ